MTRDFESRRSALIGTLSLLRQPGAWGQAPAYPTKPIRLAVGFATGGGTRCSLATWPVELMTAAPSFTGTARQR